MLPTVDRSHLIAAFAVQMQFINQDQLHAALKVWRNDQSHTLDEILLEHAWLDHETRELLVAVVERHLQVHGGNVEQGLAALSDDTMVAELPRHPSVSREQTAPQPAHDPLATVSGAAGNASPSIGRFRISGPSIKGGMGKVSPAQDQELHREVALKEIRPEFADDPTCRGRFILEAEITGGLEHPGIVPVYGLGTSPEGHPYYAMRFIRGSSLQEAIERFHASKRGNAASAEEPASDGPPRRGHSKFDSLEFRKLLDRFIDVCNAIEYAHSRGVIHRDLKPSNIMLGKYGETLVVDWGLAKVTGRDETPHCADEVTLRPASGSESPITRMGDIQGTPAYMPPEQAAGKLDQIGPASDVYSLGATLYCLLTGRAPFLSDDRANILSRVRAGDFLRPREIDSQVPKTLEAICLRAMALLPADRYPSAQAFADDVERYLAAGPAAARVERLTNPPQRGLMGWAYRNRLLATLILSLVPNAILSVANVWYDGNVVLQHVDVQAVRTFWGMLIFWKVFFYGCGMVYALWRVLPLFAAMRGPASPAELAAARRDCLRLGELVFWVSVVAWTAAGLVFPSFIGFALQFTGNENAPGYWVYAHFIGAHVICGLISGATVLSCLSFVSVRLFYPRLLRMSGPVDVRADGLLEQSKRIERFNYLAAVTPVMALILMNLVSTDYKLPIMVMTLIGLGLMYLLAVKAIPEVTADLEALARAPIPYRSDSQTR